MKRVFIAVDISQGVRQTVAEYLDTLRRSYSNIRVGWEKPEKLHLTLKFLGDVDDKRLADVEAAVRMIAGEFTAFPTALFNTGKFPPKGDPRVLWLGFKDDGAFSRLGTAVERECGNVGFAPEKRKFSPHLTIARLREPRRSHELAAKHLANEFESAEFEVSEIVIYESRLQPTGSVYQRLAAFPLQPAS